MLDTDKAPQEEPDEVIADSEYEDLGVTPTSDEDNLRETDQ